MGLSACDRELVARLVAEQVAAITGVATTGSTGGCPNCVVITEDPNGDIAVSQSAAADVVFSPGSDVRYDNLANTLTVVNPDGQDGVVFSPCPVCQTLEIDTNTGVVTVTQSDGNDFTFQTGGGTVTTFDEELEVVGTNIEPIIRFTDDDGTIVDIPYIARCGVTIVVAGQNLTGTHMGGGSGNGFIDSCVPLDMAGNPDPGTAGFNPALFPLRWRQTFDNGVTGQEYWIVLADTNGDPQWHQIA